MALIPARGLPAALERLADSGRPRLLFVAHASGGGVARHIRELSCALSSDAEILLLRPHGPDALHLQWKRDGEDFQAWFDAQQVEAGLDWLARLGIDRLHYHHVHGLPRRALEWPERLGRPYDVTLHDHFPVCPGYHLLDATGRFCGGEPGCRRCPPAPWGCSLDEWRALFAAFLEAAARVIAPSRDCAARIRRHFPRVSPLVWPHPEAPAGRARKVRVVVPGALSEAKGIAILESCAREAAGRGTALHFHVTGFLGRTLPLWPELPVTVGGEYPEGSLPELLSCERADVAFFPVQCAETFSYTLSDAMDAGLPIVATGLGALPERLAKRANATVVPWDAPASELNEALLAAAGQPPGREPSPRDLVSPSEYRERYMAPIGPQAAAPRGTVAAPDPGWLRPRVLALPDASLAWLFEDGVLRGKRASLERLRVDAAAADEALAHMRRGVEEAAAAVQRAESSREELAARLAQRESDLANAIARAAQLEADLARLRSSHSFRVTAPLRALGRLLRRG